MSFFSPYRAVLRTPRACRAFVASLAGRLCYGIVSLSMVLTLTADNRNYGFAGLVMALNGAAVVLVSPLRARLVDRRGPRRALPPLMVAFAVPLVAIALIPPDSAGNDIAIAALAVASGASAPPLGVVMRTLWSILVSDQDTLQAAYSLDGVVEELLYVVGPTIVGVLTIVASPAVGLVVTAALMLAGPAVFLRSPALDSWPLPTAEQAGGVPPAATADAAADATGAGTGRAGTTGAGTAGPVAGRSITALACATGAIGLCLGGLGLVIVAFARARHDPAAVAWVEAALSVGSALGGLGYGAVKWRLCAQRRLTLLVGGLAVMLAASAFSPNLPVLALVIALAGMLVSPALATAYVIADGLASATARNRAGNWVNSGYNAGNAAGAALSGQLVTRVPLTACLPLLALPSLLAIVPLLRTARGSGPQRRQRPRQHREAPPASHCTSAAER